MGKIFVKLFARQGGNTGLKQISETIKYRIVNVLGVRRKYFEIMARESV